MQENGLVEAIIGLPTDMFDNTGISTYVWIVSNRKPAARKGKLPIIDASSFWQKMRKSLGSKRKELSPAHIEDITRLFGSFEESSRDGVPISRIFKNEDFGYRTITVERPERDAKGKVILGLQTELQNAIMTSYDAHTSLSTQALNSPALLGGILDILLNHSHLYETLRARAAG